MKIVNAREWSEEVECKCCTSILEVGFDDLYLDPEDDEDFVQSSYARFTCPVCFRPDTVHPGFGVVCRLALELNFIEENIPQESDDEATP